MSLEASITPLQVQDTRQTWRRKRTEEAAASLAGRARARGEAASSAKLADPGYCTAPPTDRAHFLAMGTNSPPPKPKRYHQKARGADQRRRRVDLQADPEMTESEDEGEGRDPFQFAMARLATLPLPLESAD